MDTPVFDRQQGPWHEALTRLEREGRRRKLKTVTTPRRPQLTLDGQAVVDFCSNDYLGLSQHPHLVEAARKALETYGTGTGGARLIGGTLDLHMQLEEAVAAFKGTEAALVFNSGYQANVGVLSALAGRSDTILADRLNHASLVDGALLSRARLIRYPHLDLAALEAHLKATPTHRGRRFIVTDTVFSMDGDRAPLAGLFDLACRYDAWLIVDEAHATGIFGDHHRSGLWETTGLGAQERVIQVGTFSKALGSFGAYVAASREVIEALIHFSRSFVYSTSLPPAVVAANLAAIELVQTNPGPTARLWENIRQFETLSGKTNVAICSNSGGSAIFPVILGDAARTVAAARQLLEAGYYVQAIRPPTVPEGTARLRVTLCAHHTPQQIAGLHEALKTL